jgi:tetratricopeptide (TPR) repeat protein
MINNIDNIYSDFKTNYQKSPDFFIDFFERHSNYFNNISELNDKQQLKFYIEIICKYAEAIYQINRCNLAIEIVDKQQAFFDKELQRLDANELKDAWYHSLQFIKGMACYNLKDYKTATPIFKKLVQFDNQNDSYKSWLKYSRYGQKLWLVRTINIICAGLIVSETIFESQIPNYYAKQSILTIGLLGLLTNMGYEYYLKSNHRRTNSK